MDETLQFPALLRLIDDRSAAFRAAITAAPSLDVQVPTCPEWTLLDLVHHLGEGRFAWAATVAAGPDATGRVNPKDAPAAPQDREALVAWLAVSTQALVNALRYAGPNRSTWTWWRDSQSPQTSGAVARHQLQSVTVHTYDAQLTVGAPQPLPEEIALDGIDEFLSTCVATRSPWPHEPVDMEYHATEGRSWRIQFSADGARPARIPTPDTSAITAGVAATGTASDLVLFMYGRIPMNTLKIDGDPVHFDRLIAWDPTA